MGSKMRAEVVEGQYGNRPVVHSNGQTRIAMPMVYIEACASKAEQDFLWRFYQAYEFSEGLSHAVDADGEPVGRYALYASTMDPDLYERLEVQALRWIRHYGLGREWALRAEMFLRMMSESTKTTLVDLGHYLTNSDDELVALGGGQISLRDLGLVLKDAYRDFFRWYEYVRGCEEQGREPNGKEALTHLQREKEIALQIDEFRKANGLDQED